MDKNLVLEKWIPPLIGGLMAGLVAVGTNYWLIPSQKKDLAIFDEKRLAAKDLQTGFSRYLMSLSSYKQHMDTMRDVDGTNDTEVAEFKLRFNELFKEFRYQTQELSYVLATSKIYFSQPVQTRIDEFAEWHNVQDSRMTSLPPEMWTEIQQYRDWRTMLESAVREEIVGSE